LVADAGQLGGQGDVEPSAPRSSGQRSPRERVAPPAAHDSARPELSVIGSVNSLPLGPCAGMAVGEYPARYFATRSPASFS
jgi:hypothetical protein